ncbi:hypothetical protein D3C84_588210 [compost metagenome]
MLVSDDQGRSVVGKCPLNNDAGMDLSGIDGASEQRFTGDDLMLGIQKYGDEHFAGFRHQFQAQIVAGDLWVRHLGAVDEQPALQQPNGLRDDAVLVLEDRCRTGFCWGVETG